MGPELSFGLNNRDPWKSMSPSNDAFSMAKKKHGVQISNKISMDIDIYIYILYTLPEANISPENRPLEEEIPIGNHHFQGLC